MDPDKTAPLGISLIWVHTVYYKDISKVPGDDTQQKIFSRDKQPEMLKLLMICFSTYFQRNGSLFCLWRVRVKELYVFKNLPKQYCFVQTTSILTDAGTSVNKTFLKKIVADINPLVFFRQ